MQNRKYTPEEYKERLLKEVLCKIDKTEENIKYLLEDTVKMVREQNIKKEKEAREKINSVIRFIIYSLIVFLSGVISRFLWDL